MRIVTSELAPAGEVHYSLANVEFDLSPGGTYETDDPVVAGAANVHPWLDVEYDSSDSYESRVPGLSVKPEDDGLSAYGPNARVPFDHDAIREVEDAKFVDLGTRVAIEAGKDQNESVVTGGVAETLEGAEQLESERAKAADDEKTEPAKPSMAPAKPAPAPKPEKTTNDEEDNS